jgi:hypothetical protein
MFQAVNRKFGEDPKRAPESCDTAFITKVDFATLVQPAAALDVNLFECMALVLKAY